MGYIFLGDVLITEASNVIHYENRRVVSLTVTAPPGSSHQHPPSLYRFSLTIPVIVHLSSIDTSGGC